MSPTRAARDTLTGSSDERSQCCGRTFKQLARHMETKHPDYAESNGDAAA